LTDFGRLVDGFRLIETFHKTKKNGDCVPR